MTTFKVTVLRTDGYAVPPFDLIVPENSLFVANNEFPDTHSVIIVSKELSTQKYYVAETVSQLSSSANGNSAEYQTYYALVTQTATGAPSANVLNASTTYFLGNIVWARTGAGFYTATLTGKLTAGATFIYPIYKNDGTLALVDTTNLPNSFSINTGTDDKLSAAPVEVKVFQSVAWT